MDPLHDINSIGDLLVRLREDANPGSEHWYRGQSDFDWKLVPSLGRPENDMRSELHLVERFKQNATLLLQPLPANDWEWLTIMQHHRVPTRLLDWSESPLIALYFALSDLIDHGQANTDGALWLLDPVALNRTARVPVSYPSYIPSFDDARLTDNYLPQNLAAELSSVLPPMAVVGYRNTRRMQAQLGTFTLVHREPTAIEDVGDSSHIVKYRVPRDIKPELLRELTLLAINRFQLFPELESLGTILREN